MDTIKRQKASGVITVFLSLVLVLVMSLIFTCLESARNEGLRLRARQIADSALESVFAQYDRVLWEEYGLLFFVDQGSEENAYELEDILLEYAEKNAQGDDMTGLTDKNQLKLYAADATATNVAFAMDQRGNIFRYSVYEYMKSAGLIESATRLFNMLEIDEAALDSCEDAGELSFDEIASQVSKAGENLDNPESSGTGSGLSGGADTAAPASIWKDEAQTYCSDLFGEFMDWRTTNILKLVIDDVDSVSKRKLDDTELPSKLPEELRTNSSLTITDELPLETICFNEYVMQKTECYTSAQKKYLETEYVVIGDDNDRDNLCGVVKRLLGIRFAYDMVYYFSSTDDLAMAEAIADAAAGWTGNAAIVKGIKSTILTIWAVREAISDVRRLLRGESIPLVKSTDAGTKEDVGLSYEDYLRILLFLSDSEEITYRMMDVAQRRVRISEPAFRFSRAVFGAEASLSFEGNSFFPFLPESVSYLYSENASYAYATGIVFDE